MNKTAKIYVAGHRGMVGSSIMLELKKQGFDNVITRTHAELDLIDSVAVKDFFKSEKPQFVFLSAARVGGIKANMEHPAEFLYENLKIQNNVIHNAYLNKVDKLCFLGSSCIYPRDCAQPMKEEYLMTGPLEPTNEGYALAKIAGYKMCLFYAKEFGMNNISLMPCNLYGRNDHFDLETCHVLSALVKRFSDAVSEGKKEVILWGTGIAKREFMNVDDMGRIAVDLMQKYNDPEIINIGTGTDISIKELANLIADKTGYKGNIKWDSTKPDGMLKKCLDISKMKALEIKAEITLEQGVIQMIQMYKKLKEEDSN